MRRSLVVLFALLTCLVPIAKAQNGPEKIDAKPFAPTEGSSFEQVSNANGSLNLNVPVWSFHQRGKLHLDFSLRYDSPTYHFFWYCQQLNEQPYAGSGNNADPNFSSPPQTCDHYPFCYSNHVEVCTNYWELSYDSDIPARLADAEGVRLSASTDVNVIPAIEYTSGSYGSQIMADYYWKVRTPDGALHKMVPTSDSTYRAWDGSGWQYVPSTCTLRDSDGVTYVFACAQASGITAGVGTYPMALIREEDTNGNVITLRYTGDPASAAAVFIGWTDSFGRDIPTYDRAVASTATGCPTGGVGSLWEIPGVGNPLILCSTAVTYQTNLNYKPSLGTSLPSLGGEASGTFDTLSAVTLPNGDTWKFEYTPLPDDPLVNTQYNFGELRKITLPTGGNITYLWSHIKPGCSVHPVQSIERSQIYERRIYVDANAQPATWLYGIGNADLDGYTTTVTDPYNNTVVHTMTGYCGAYESSAVHADASGNTVRTDQTDYLFLPTVPIFTIGTDPISTAALPSANRTIWPDGTTKETRYEYGNSYTAYGANGTVVVPHGMPTLEEDYDYGTDQKSGSLLRTSATSFWFAANQGAYANNLLTLPLSSTITDASTGKASITSYSYDEYAVTSGNAVAPGWDSNPANGGVRGNLTGESRFLDTANTWLTTVLKYSDTGMVTSLSLPANAPYADTTTTYQYSAAYQGGLLTLETNAASQTNVYSYDPSTLELTSKTDANNQVTSYSYYPDLRLESVIGPTTTDGQAETDYNYPSAVKVQKKIKQNASSWMITDSTVDGLGRPVKSETENACSSGSSAGVDTSYDLMDRILSVTNPYCSGTTPTDVTYHGTLAGGVVTPGYDAIGRPTVLTLPDGSVQTWSYVDNSTTSVDEARNSWTRTTDALGRLTSVVEPDNLSTTYTYNAFGDLLHVNQVGVPGSLPFGANTSAEVSKSRDFTYDSLSRLITSRNPETGSICYGSSKTGSCTGGYDAHGNLLHKTNANGQTIDYTYDALNRLVSKTSQQDSETNFGYTYDQGPNGIGRLSGEARPNAAGTQYFYDAMGRVNYSLWYGYSYHSWLSGLAVTYDLAGNVTQMSYPYSPRQIQQTWDSAGHLTQIQDVTGGTAGVNYFSNATYSPSGALTSATYGNGVTEFVSQNSRLQPCRISANTPVGFQVSGGYNLYDRQVFYGQTAETNCGSAASNNGNIWHIVEGSTANTPSQNFTYDALNRLTSAYTANRPAEGTYNHTYNYDSFGNMLKHDAINGDLAYGIDSATNRLTLNGSLTAGDLRYDNAGNLVSFPNPLGGSRSAWFTAEGDIRCISDGGNGCGLASYLYNGSGERVFSAPNNQYSRQSMYFNSQVMEEILVDTSAVTDYIYANGQKIARIENTPNAPTTHYYLDDHLGTTQMELSATGAVEWQGYFDPWGKELMQPQALGPQVNDGTNMRFKFTGKERDTESGLDYFGARYYASSMGRWMSPDWSPNPVPLPFGDIAHPQTLNLYGYAGNNPITNIDPDGHLDCGSGGASETASNGILKGISSFFHGIACGAAKVFSGLGGGNSGAQPQTSASGGQREPTFVTSSRLMYPSLAGNYNSGAGYGGGFAFGVAIPGRDNALSAGQVSGDILGDSYGGALAGSSGGTIPLGPPGNTYPSDPTSWGVGLYGGTSAHVTFGNGSLADVRGPFHTTNFNLAWNVEIGGFSYSYSGKTWQMTISIPGTGPGWGAEMTHYTTTTCVVGSGCK